MDRFRVHDGQFWINDTPVLIQAGEFHYFRTPADQWPHRLGLLRQAGFNAVAAYIPWLWHAPAPGVLDLDGHTHPLRNLAGYLDLAAEMGFYLIPRPGPYIMAETINEGIPPWVFDQHPQIALRDQHGATHALASYLHPDFLARVAEWYAAVFAVLAPRQITRGGRIILAQLDNEMGMPHWVRNLIDTNPDTLARFAAYLQTTYGGALPARYAAADLPRALGEALTQPEAASAPALLQDYKRFFRQYLRTYLRWLWDTAQTHGLEVPPVVNIHGFANGGKTFPIGLSQLVEAMALEGMVSATDVYPIKIGEGNFHELLLVNAATTALHNPHQALFSIEFQAGGNLDFGGSQASLYDLHTRLCLASGMRAINHYLFFDGENHPLLSPVKRHAWGHPVRKDGTLRAHYARYPRLSRVLAAYGEALVRARPLTTATLGFVLDHFMTEVHTARTREADQQLTHRRDVVVFDMLARGLALTHRPFDAVAIDRGDLDPARSPVAWVMVDRQCPPEAQARLVDYARRGGRLVIAGRMCVEALDGAPCTTLKDALGIQAIHSAPPEEAAALEAFGLTDLAPAFLETYTGAFDEVVAIDAHGATVGFVQTLGAGRVLVLGAGLPIHHLDELEVIQRMAAKLGCPPLVEAQPWVEAHLSQGEQGSFLFLQNYQDDPVTTTLTYERQPMLGDHPVLVPARAGLILPVDWRVNDAITLHYATAEVSDLTEAGPHLRLTLSQAAFTAELTLRGYRCAGAVPLAHTPAGQRVRVRGTEGVILLECEAGL